MYYYVTLESLINSQPGFYIGDLIQKGELPAHKQVIVHVECTGNYAQDRDMCFAMTQKYISNLMLLLMSHSLVPKKEFIFWDVKPHVNILKLKSLDEGVEECPYEGYKTKEEAKEELKRKIEKEIEKLRSL